MIKKNCYGSRRQIMKYLKAAAIVLVLLSGAVLEARVEKTELWGSQTKSWVTGYQRSDGNKVVLDKPAKIANISGNAASFCIWSGGKAVLCGTPEFSLIGKTLEKDRYTLFPELAPAQRKGEVRIVLEYLE
jgi:hypothetical protein